MVCLRHWRWRTATAGLPSQSRFTTQLEVRREPQRAALEANQQQMRLISEFIPNLNVQFGGYIRASDGN